MKNEKKKKRNKIVRECDKSKIGEHMRKDKTGKSKMREGVTWISLA